MPIVVDWDVKQQSKQTDTQRSISGLGNILEQVSEYNWAVSRSTTEPIKWHVHPAKTQINLDWSKASLSTK